MKHTIYKIAAAALPMVAIVSAQPDFPSGPAQAPIGGLGLLAAAGGAWAVKKLRDKNKK